MSLWQGQPLVLASRSAARRAVLEAAGVPVEIRPADIDERAAASRLTAGPQEVAAGLARAKAQAISPRLPGRLVIGADQVLALGTQLFAKPDNADAARDQLTALSGRTHELHSALTAVRGGDVLFEHVGTARLTMRRLSPQFIAQYLDDVGAAAMASVGAYQLEGLGVQLFERVEGDYFTILGLPLLPLLGFLRQEGVLAG
jgi:septum formation protein